ncbi:NAD(+) kinase, partial [bacterium]|nr:NAD(+) kinase [bacterium]
PISPHSLGARPVVIPAQMAVSVEVEFAPEQVMLTADGQVTLELPVRQRVRITKARHTVKLVSYGGRSFYDRLRTKLNWGEDIRKE